MKKESKLVHQKFRVFLLAMLCLLLALPTPVSAASASIKLNASKKTLLVGGSVKLKATVTGKSKTVTWKSSNRAVATVSKNGKVTAKKAGKATITAKANGKTEKCVVTVEKLRGTTGTFQKRVPFTNLAGAKMNHDTVVVISKISGGKIVFWAYEVANVEYYNVKVTATLNGNAATFKWKYSDWRDREKSGTGRIILYRDKVKIRMNPDEEYQTLKKISEEATY